MSWSGEDFFGELDELDPRVLKTLFEAIVAAKEGSQKAASEALDAFLELHPSFGSGVATARLIARTRYHLDHTEERK